MTFPSHIPQEFTCVGFEDFRHIVAMSATKVKCDAVAAVAATDPIAASTASVFDARMFTDIVRRLVYGDVTPDAAACEQKQRKLLRGGRAEMT